MSRLPRFANSLALHRYQCTRLRRKSDLNFSRSIWSTSPHHTIIITSSSRVPRARRVGQRDRSSRVTAETTHAARGKKKEPYIELSELTNSEITIVVQRDQKFYSSVPGTYPRGSRKTPPHRDIRGRVLRLANLHQRLTPPSTTQMVHYINSSPVFIQVRRNRSRRPALGGREKNSTRQLPSLCSFPSVC